VTTVHTNASGFRGADLPTPTEDEILVVGDHAEIVNLRGVAWP